MTPEASSRPRKPHRGRWRLIKSALVRRSDLKDISTAPPHSPPRPRPCATRQDEQDRGPNPDAGIRRNASDGHGPVPMIIRVSTSTFAADLSPKWPNTRPPKGRAKADREGGERQHGPDAVVEFKREVQMIEDKPRDNAVQEEVIPLYDGPYE